MLMLYNFFRPHNSFLVNLRRVNEFIRGDGGYLVMENKMKIPVSKNKREELMELLGLKGFQFGLVFISNVCHTYGSFLKL